MCVLCFGCSILPIQPKQGEILQILIDYFNYISYLYFGTITIYNFLNANINAYRHFTEK